ncbi:GroES-like protein [Aspergillus steynii IBT 23096]|uniref:GroES-like protein n=1 Tax=Aspergillus steynii IBT 23096 TaxID=1392250 RepID=A0A2I2GSP6_9EURO|nr:GroES-like protein [Aspergillus steynii IBT 23096]PLB55880.1 GroES-like protein [Aspergillus steynii IBT 23096]
MKALQFHASGDLRLEELEDPICGKGEVKMRTAFCGLCGTDIHEFCAGPVLIPQKPHPITGATLPVTMGHELSGIVTEVGEGCERIKVGQRVVVRPTIYDEQCASCRQGVRHCCENIGFIGLSGMWLPDEQHSKGYGGGMAEYIVAPASHFYALPDNVALDMAALIEPMAVAWHAVNVSPFKFGDTAVIVGGGPIGICVIQVLKLQGAKEIIVAEPMEGRKKLARHYGATEILDPGSEEVPKRVQEMTRHRGADVIFDTAGVEGALNSVISACRTHGAIVNIAVWEKRPELHVNDLMYREVQYMQSALYDEMSFKNTIEALSYGQLNPREMITSKIRLEDVVEKGFKALVEDRDRHCKILVDVQASECSENGPKN